MLLYLELAGGLILLELREVGHTGPRRLVMGDTEDLAADLEEGSEVGVLRQGDFLFQTISQQNGCLNRLQCESLLPV